MKLTKRSIEAIKPNPDKRRYLFFDEYPGLGLAVQPSGRMTFFFQYRTAGGRAGSAKRVSLGSWPAMTPELALREAKKVAGSVSQGIDPASVAREKRKAQSVTDVMEIFFQAHVEAKRKPRTQSDYRYILDRYLIPRLGRHKVKDVTRRHIEQMHLAMRDTPTSANRSLAVASKFFNWCEQRGFREDNTNPCRHVERYPERKRERFLSADELFRLGEALAELEGSGAVTGQMAAVFRLLVFTGARKEEVLTLRWDALDLDRGLARLADSKTGAKTIHLPAPAVEVLRALPQVDEYVFPSSGRRGHLTWPYKAWGRVLECAGLDNLRLHDLRHSFASVAASSGHSLPMVGAMLGHTQPSTTQRYAHLAQNPVHQAAEDTAARIAAAMGGGGKVVRLKK